MFFLLCDDVFFVETGMVRVDNAPITAGLSMWHLYLFPFWKCCFQFHPSWGQRVQTTSWHLNTSGKGGPCYIVAMPSVWNDDVSLLDTADPINSLFKCTCSCPSMPHFYLLSSNVVFFCFTLAVSSIMLLHIEPNHNWLCLSLTLISCCLINWTLALLLLWENSNNSN